MVGDRLSLPGAFAAARPELDVSALRDRALEARAAARGATDVKRVMELTVWIKPEPQRRARHSTQGGVHRTYPHPGSAAYKAMVIAAYQAEFWQERKGWIMFQKDVPLVASLIAHVPCPASVSMKRRREGRAGWPSGRNGDLDNIEKAAWDALQSFAYHNDNQIKMHTQPYYITYAFDQRTGEDTTPHLYIRLEEL